VREVGVTMPVLYYHFGNKAELLRAVFEARGQWISTELKVDPVIGFEAVCKALVDHALEHLSDLRDGLRLRILLGFESGPEVETLRPAHRDCHGLEHCLHAEEHADLIDHRGAQETVDGLVDNGTGLKDSGTVYQRVDPAEPLECLRYDGCPALARCYVVRQRHYAVFGVGRLQIGRRDHCADCGACLHDLAADSPGRACNDYRPAGQAVGGKEHQITLVRRNFARSSAE